MATVTGLDRSCHPYVISLSTTDLRAADLAADLAEGSPNSFRSVSAVLA